LPSYTVISRLGTADALKLVERITQAGGSIAAIDLGIDPATPFGEFGTTLMLALAHMERRRLTDLVFEPKSRHLLPLRRRGVPRGISQSRR